MPNTPILGITQVSASQAAKEVTINDAILALENATNSKLDVSFAAGVTRTLTASETTRNFIFVAVGATAPSTLNIPNTVFGNNLTRLFVVRNNSGHGLTVKFATGAGSSIVIPDGAARLLSALDGVDIIVAAEPATTVTFLDLTDTPNAYAGQTGKFLGVNVAENALEFLNAATFPTLAGNAGKFLVVNAGATGVEWVSLSIAVTFLQLTDTPDSYTGQANKLVGVNAGATGLEFIDAPEAELVEFISAERWRLRIVTYGSDPQVGFGELEFRDVDGIDLTTGGTASASTQALGKEASRAFDNNTDAGEGWLSAIGFAGTVWIEYDFPAPVTVRSVRAFPVTLFPNYSPARFVIEAFVGGVWTPLGDRVAATWVEATSQTFRVNGVPSSSIVDAPTDGVAYYRRDNDWRAVSTDGAFAADSDAVIPSQRAIKAYVDNRLAARSWKDPVRVASTASIVLASGAQNGAVMDGVTLGTGDRILLKDQAGGVENGIYTVNSSGAPTRAADANSSAELFGAATLVSEGTVNGNKQFICTNDSIILGATPLVFSELAGTTPTLDTDVTLAANSDIVIASQRAIKSYVDNRLAARSWKDPVRVASTAPLTLASGAQNGSTIDGVTLITGDRILLKNQASGAENGIYTVNSSGPPTRGLDADTGAELVGAATFVSEGVVNGNKQFVCTTDGPIVPGTTALLFAELAGGGSTPIDTDVTLAANSDTVVPSQRAAKAYVDNNLLARSWKQPVRVASTATINFASGAQNGSTIDGVTLFTGDRILVKNQADGSQNGIYTVNASGPPTRATDADTLTEFAGAAVIVLAGSVNINRVFACTSPGILLGVDNVFFGQIGGEPVVKTVTATSYDLLAADSRNYLRFTATTAKTLNVRPEATHAIPDNGEFNIRNAAAENLTIVAGSGVTILPPAGGTLLVPILGTVTLKRVGVNTYDLMGYTVAA